MQNVFFAQSELFRPNTPVWFIFAILWLFAFDHFCTDRLILDYLICASYFYFHNHWKYQVRSRPQKPQTHHRIPKISNSIVTHHRDFCASKNIWNDTANCTKTTGTPQKVEFLRKTQKNYLPTLCKMCFLRNRNCFVLILLFDYFRNFVTFCFRSFLPWPSDSRLFNLCLIFLFPQPLEISS